MLARFIGDPRNGGDGPRLVSTFGFEFIKGDWRDVSDECALKLVGNDHFEVEGLTANEGQYVVVDSGGEGAALLDDVNALRAMLDARGIAYHHKAGVAKLRALLEA